MDLKALTELALQLPLEERARLVQELLESLEALPESEVDRLWLDEAARRAAQLDRGEAQLVPADEVLRKARALLK
jgi:putative addiction module component (TIGR02574 family)